MAVKERTSFEIYVNELRNNNCQAICIDEELDLLKNASKGDKKSIEKIIKGNLRFVISVAKKYAKNNENLMEDLIQAGNIALYESFESFDYNKFVKSGCKRFISYAGLRIAQKIALESKRTFAVSITDGKFKELKKLKSELETIESNLNYFGNLSEIEKIEIAAKNLGIKKSVAMNLYNSSLVAASTDFTYEDDESPLSDKLSDDNYMTPEDEAIFNVSKMELKKSLKKLNRIEEEVIVLAYGLDGKKPLNYPAIGNKIGYTREGVRLIHNRAIEHLREEMGYSA